MIAMSAASLRPSSTFGRAGVAVRVLASLAARGRRHVPPAVRRERRCQRSALLTGLRLLFTFRLAAQRRAPGIRPSAERVDALAAECLADTPRHEAAPAAVS